MRRLVFEVVRRASTPTLLIGAQGNAADQAKWNDLSVWKNHYPVDRLGQGKTSFFQNPRIARAIDAALPAADRELLRHAYTLGDSFSASGHYLIGDVCRPHDCGAENATVVFDLNVDNLWIAMFSHVRGTVSTGWFGTADYVDLPPSVPAAVLSVHRPAL